MGKPYEIKISGQFSAVRQLEAFSDDIRQRRRRLPVHLDLSRVRFMRPLAVVGTVLFMEEMISRGRTLQVAFPQNAGVLNYLVGIGLPDVMDQLGEWQWPESFPEKATQGLRPMIKVTRFSSSDEIERISIQMDRSMTMHGTMSYSAGMGRRCGCTSMVSNSKKLHPNQAY